MSHSGITTTAIACIARSPVSRQRSVPARCAPRPCTGSLLLAAGLPGRVRTPDRRLTTSSPSTAAPITEFRLCQRRPPI